MPDLPILALAAVLAMTVGFEASGVGRLSSLAVALSEGAQASRGTALDDVRTVGAVGVSAEREGGLVAPASERRRSERDLAGAPAAKGEGPVGAVEVGVASMLETALDGTGVALGSSIPLGRFAVQRTIRKARQSIAR